MTLLVRHPDTPPGAIVTVDAELRPRADGATATWFGDRRRRRGSIVPTPADAGARRRLWKTTCFEAFVRPARADAYREWNFAPSGQWAAYDFDGYREGMTRADVGATPYIRMEDNLTWWTLGATIAVECRTQLATRPVAP